MTIPSNLPLNAFQEAKLLLNAYEKTHQILKQIENEGMKCKQAVSEYNDLQEKKRMELHEIAKLVEKVNTAFYSVLSEQGNT